MEFGVDRASSEANSDFRAVQIIEQELGSPPLLVVPFSNNYGAGASCVPEHHLQLVELGERELRLRGNVLLSGRALRALPVDGALYAVTTQEVAAIDSANRDAPRMAQALSIGNPQVHEACVLAPEAPRQTITASPPSASTASNWSGGSDSCDSSGGELAGCSMAAPYPPASRCYTFWLFALSFVVLGARRSAHRTLGR